VKLEPVFQINAKNEGWAVVLTPAQSVFFIIIFVFYLNNQA